MIGVFVDNECRLLAAFGSEHPGRTVHPFGGLVALALCLSWRSTSGRGNRGRLRSGGSYNRFFSNHEEGMPGSDRARGHSLARFGTDHLADEMRERGRKVAFPPEPAGQGPLVCKAGASRSRSQRRTSVILAPPGMHVSRGTHSIRRERRGSGKSRPRSPRKAGEQEKRQYRRQKQRGGQRLTVLPTTISYMVT